MKKGKILVIEGVDSVGKKTQTLELEKHLKSSGYKVFHHSFPSYEEDQSILVKMYLNGAFGNDVNCVNYKVASSFYAVDIIATYLLEIKEKLEEGYIAILDRYTTSNMVHQASKLDTENEMLEAIKWIDNYEFNDLGLPRPDGVFYLTINKGIREKLLDNRRTEEEKDINEKDKEYLAKCSKSGLMIAKYNKWNIIDCSDTKNIRSIESISDEIYEKALEIINAD